MPAQTAVIERPTEPARQRGVTKREEDVSSKGVLDLHAELRLIWALKNQRELQDEFHDESSSVRRGMSDNERQTQRSERKVKGLSGKLFERREKA